MNPWNSVATYRRNRQAWGLLIAGLIRSAMSRPPDFFRRRLAGGDSTVSSIDETYQWFHPAGPVYFFGCGPVPRWEKCGLRGGSGFTPCAESGFPLRLCASARVPALAFSNLHLKSKRSVARPLRSRRKGAEEIYNSPEPGKVFNAERAENAEDGGRTPEARCRRPDAGGRRPEDGLSVRW